MKWMLKQGQIQYSQRQSEKYSHHFLNLLSVRGVLESEIEEYLNPNMALLSTLSLSGTEDMITVFSKFSKTQCGILIFGDYDVDGIMSTYILYEGLKKIGFQKIEYYIPHRVLDGYGLKKSTLAGMDLSAIDVVITCDNGISAIEAILYLKEKGIDVIITDHHEPIEEKGRILLPQADAIINPKKDASSEEPLEHICGATVAAIAMQALSNHYQKSYDWEGALPFLAIATICDVMPLLSINRLLVKEGLLRLKEVQNVGLFSLMAKLNIDLAKIDTYHIGYLIGPCFNAAGRLETASLGMALLLEKDETRGEKMAQQLIEINDKRKSITELGLAQAIARIDADKKYQNPIIIVVLADVHESIAGIVAGRIKEQYHRPALVFVENESELLKGSGRSIEAINLYDILSQYRHLFTAFGGHKMACGASITPKALLSLEEKIKALSFPAEIFLPQWRIDLAIPFKDVDEAFFKEVSLLSPFGKDNEKPLFAQRNVCFSEVRRFDGKIAVYRMRLIDESQVQKTGVYFDFKNIMAKKLEDMLGEGSYEAWLNGEKQYYFDVIFDVDQNEYLGKTNIQLKIIDFRPAKGQ